MDSSTIPQKRCSRKTECLHPQSYGGWLPATREYFHRKRDSSDGLNNKCKVCNVSAGRAWAKAHPEQTKAYQDAYRETHVGELRAWRQGYHAKNRDRHLVEFAQYERRNATRLKQRRHTHYVENAIRIKVATRQRKIQRKGAPGAYTAQDEQLLLRSQKGLCWWCGEPVGDKYHVDHRIPISRGGTNYPENLCIACPSCNLSKHDKLPFEWNGRLL